MNRIKVAPTYSSEYLETERPQPLSDNHIESLIQDVLSGKLDRDITDSVYDNFKEEMHDWLVNSTLNDIYGYGNFSRVDIVNGCTQFIDNLYMQGPVQTLKGDYRYHERLNLGSIVDELKPNIPLIIAMPFPSTGDVYHNMNDLLTDALEKNVPVHLDGAWITTCKDIVFDLTHPAIKSVGVSLSKGLGLGWNRVGLRFTRQPVQDSVTIMNDFRMNNRALCMIGLHFLRNLQPDYLWYTHGHRYYTICEDFDLTPTKSIYLALRGNQPVGVSPLIRYLENANR